VRRLHSLSPWLILRVPPLLTIAALSWACSGPRSGQGRAGADFESDCIHRSGFTKYRSIERAAPENEQMDEVACSESKICIDWGWCGKSCRAAAANTCRKSNGCRLWGDCSVYKGRCRAEKNIMCARSVACEKYNACEKYKMCIASNGICVSDPMEQCGSGIDRMNGSCIHGAYLLAQAQRAVTIGELERALDLSLQVLNRDPRSEPALRVVIFAACVERNVEIARWAFLKLRYRCSRELATLVCARRGIQIPKRPKRR